MLETLLSGGIGSILGGITGLIGTYLNNKRELELAKLKAAEAANKRKHEVTINTQRHKITMEQNKAQFEHEDNVQAELSLRESYEMAETERFEPPKEKGWFASFFFGLVEILRRMIRVTASYGSMVILGYITYFVYNNLDKFLYQLQSVNEGAKAFALMEYLVFTICYLSTTIILWWFGTRTKKPPVLS